MTDNVDKMMAWESGELSDKDTIKLFQELVKDNKKKSKNRRKILLQKKVK